MEWQSMAEPKSTMVARIWLCFLQWKSIHVWDNTLAWLRLQKNCGRIVYGETWWQVDLLPETEQLIIKLAMLEEICMAKRILKVIPITSGFKKWKESTLTLPSGWHLGHYNAIVNDLEKENRDLNLTESFATVTSISLWFGWLHSWKVAQVHDSHDWKGSS